MQKIRVATSLGNGFAGTFQDIWGLEDYNPEKDLNEPCVFVGLYGLPDFYALWRHKGKKYIFWCGSDILHFKNGYWLDDKGEICLDYIPLAEWINKNCESYVENEVEWQALKDCWIESKIIPSFLGDVKNFKPQKLSKELRYYSSVSGNNFEQYGWDKINEIAKKNPKTLYYLYGNTKPWEGPKNVIVRGRVTQQQMDKETKSMTGALVMLEFAGFSEILAKSILWGQKPISLIKYNYTRESLLKVLNKFPWVTK